MPLFLDVHSLGDYTEKQLATTIEDNMDEFGVVVHQMLFNEKKNILQCICSAPDIESVKKHHMKFNIKCDKIFPIKQIKSEKIIQDEKFKKIGIYSSNLTHNLRNSMSIILTSLDNLKLKYNVDNSSQKEFDKIIRSINNISNQIDDVLNFVKHTPSIFKKSLLSEIFNESLSLIAIPPNVHITLPKNDAELFCDKRKLSTAFSNLILNSIQSVDKCGTIKIRMQKTDDKIVLEFEDSGPGIPEELTTKIFEPLFTTKQTGTGLGLANVLSIISEHHGTISVTSPPTIFQIIFPKGS